MATEPFWVACASLHPLNATAYSPDAGKSTSHGQSMCTHPPTRTVGRGKRRSTLHLWPSMALAASTSPSPSSLRIACDEHVAPLHWTSSTTLTPKPHSSPSL